MAPKADRMIGAPDSPARARQVTTDAGRCMRTIVWRGRFMRVLASRDGFFAHCHDNTGNSRYGASDAAD